MEVGSMDSLAVHPERLAALTPQAFAKNGGGWVSDV